MNQVNPHSRRKMQLLIAMLGIMLILRLVNIFEIFPGNAPDEVAHMTMVTALSQGKLLTLKETLEYNQYPYAIYNPIAYLPSAVVLGLASLGDQELLKMTKPMNSFLHRATYWARLGQIFWFFVFAIFIFKLIRERPFFEASLWLGFIGFLPQLNFVQSYVNLDAMGVSAFVYLVWALQNKRLGNIALATFLVTSSKLNYFCILPLPFLIFWSNYRNEFKLFVKNTLLFLVLPIAVASLWFVYSYFVNTRIYGSFLGMSALNQIYQQQGGGTLVFSQSFIAISIKSLIGVFGYLNQPLPKLNFYLWILVGMLPGLSYLGYRVYNSIFKKIDYWDLGFMCVLILNFLMHFLASYGGAYQAQGRYLFSAGIILFLYSARILSLILTRIPSQKISYAVDILILTLALISSVEGISTAAKNPFHLGFTQIEN